MSATTSPEQGDLVLRAIAGDQHAFEALLLESRPRLAAVIRRMVGHPEDCADLVQDSIVRAWETLPTFRGDSTFGTWLCAIGVRKAIDHLRRQKRWRVEAQVVCANECFGSPELQAQVFGALSDPAFVYDVEEHIAFCFTCVGRSLPPEEQAALVLREVLGMTAREAARALEISESVLRHRLASARRAMEQNFDGLCSLVGKQGVCYQCKGLRDATPPSRQGREPVRLVDLDQRIEIVSRADPDAGASQALHDLLWCKMKDIEASGRGSTEPESACGQPGES